MRVPASARNEHEIGCQEWLDFVTRTELAVFIDYLVPAERFELPTNGLQNRCSTTELCRRLVKSR